MTGKERKPQSPKADAFTIRQQTNFGDGTSKWSILHGARPQYERVPKGKDPQEMPVNTRKSAE